MNRLLSSLTLLVLLMAACQPIRPESELAAQATGEATTAITNTATLTDTTPITSSNAITSADNMTATTTGTPRTSGQTTSTPSTPASGSSAGTASCPAIDNSASDIDAVDIDVVANWQEGEQRTYLITQRRVDSDSGQETVTLASTTPVTITVIRANDDGYEMEWHYGQAQLGETDLEADDPLVALFQTPLEVHFRYATDRDGVFTELLNLEELQEQLLPLFDQLFDILEESDEEITPEAMAAARSMVDNLVSDPANFEALFTRDVQLFHSAFNFYFEDAEPLVLPDVRPNMLGGSPIPSELTVKPTGYDVEEDCLHIELENIADPVEARNSILEALQEQARQMGVPSPSETDLPAELDMVDNVRFEMELASGWPTAIYTERAITFATQSRLETANIRLVEPE